MCISDKLRQFSLQEIIKNSAAVHIFFVFFWSAWYIIYNAEFLLTYQYDIHMCMISVASVCFIVFFPYYIFLFFIKKINFCRNLFLILFVIIYSMQISLWIFLVFVHGLKYGFLTIVITSISFFCGICLTICIGHIIHLFFVHKKSLIAFVQKKQNFTYVK